jgi:hypothetical protein
METVSFVFKVVASLLLGMIALASLLRCIYLVIKSWRIPGKSPASAAARTALAVATLNFVAGVAVSLIVFLWNPVLILLLVLLVLSLFWAWLVYISEASPHELAGWWQKMKKNVRSDEKRGE